jgi:2'-5' RNA ligase superfamily
VPLASGIVLPVAEAESLFGDLRQLHDPQARYGVPAHITLLYPFAHPSKVAETVGPLRRLFGLVPAFEFSLVAVRRFPVTAYLHPEPSATFVRLAEILVSEWPEFPPYGGSFSTVIPHLAIADQATPDTLDQVDASVSPQLPIRCRATEAWLMCSDEQGRWTRYAVLPFSVK